MKKNTKYITKIVSTLLSVLVVTNMQTTKMDAKNTPPRLLLCITVDQLTTDQLLYFRQFLGQDGLNKLVEKGLVYSGIQYTFHPKDATAAIASLYTGTNPNANGVGDDIAYDYSKNRYYSIFHDNNYIGYGTSNRLSPLALNCNTIGDELKLSTDGKSKVYSIAPNASEAIAAGGHLANGAFWIDNDTGNWSTSTYYGDGATYIVQNAPTLLKSKIIWTPGVRVYDNSLFPYTNKGGDSPFKYTLESKDVKRIKETPIINDQISNLAIQLIKRCCQGPTTSSTPPSALFITFRVGGPSWIPGTTLSSYEALDSYFKLDRDIALLLKVIEKSIGYDKCLICVAGSGGYYAPTQYKNEANQQIALYKRTISLERIKALANLYLIAKYGQGNWIKSCRNGFINLNKDLIKQKKLSEVAVQKECAIVVSQMEGIELCLPTSSLQTTEFSGEISNQFLQGVSRKEIERSDILFKVRKNYEINEQISPTLAHHNYNFSGNVLSPFILFGSGLSPRKITEKPISVLQIASTLSSLLKIRPPTSTKSLPNTQIIAL